MERKIHWTTGTFPHLEGVYEKAAKDAGLAHFLQNAEEAALREVHDSSILIQTSTGPILPEMTEKLSMEDKERIMGYLATAGIEELSADFRRQTVNVRFSKLMMDTMLSSMFSLLDALEVLDQAGQSESTRVTLEMKVPVGAGKVLPAWQIFLTRLYPWIGNVKETSTGEPAIHLELMPEQTKM